MPSEAARTQMTETFQSMTVNSTGLQLARYDPILSIFPQSQQRSSSFDKAQDHIGLGMEEIGGNRWETEYEKQTGALRSAQRSLLNQANSMSAARAAHSRSDDEHYAATQRKVEKHLRSVGLDPSELMSTSEHVAKYQWPLAERDPPKSPKTSPTAVSELNLFDEKNATAENHWQRSSTVTREQYHAFTPAEMEESHVHAQRSGEENPKLFAWSLVRNDLPPPPPAHQTTRKFEGTSENREKFRWPPLDVVHLTPPQAPSYPTSSARDSLNVLDGVVGDKREHELQRKRSETAQQFTERAKTPDPAMTAGKTAHVSDDYPMQFAWFPAGPDADKSPPAAPVSPSKRNLMASEYKSKFNATSAVLAKDLPIAGTRSHASDGERIQLSMDEPQCQGWRSEYDAACEKEEGARKSGEIAPLAGTSSHQGEKAIPTFYAWNDPPPQPPKEQVPRKSSKPLETEYRHEFVPKNNLAAAEPQRVAGKVADGAAAAHQGARDALFELQQGAEAESQPMVSEYDEKFVPIIPSSSSTDGTAQRSALSRSGSVNPYHFAWGLVDERPDTPPKPRGRTSPPELDGTESHEKFQWHGGSTPERVRRSQAEAHHETPLAVDQDAMDAAAWSTEYDTQFSPSHDGKSTGGVPAGRHTERDSKAPANFAWPKQPKPDVPLEFVPKPRPFSEVIGSEYDSSFVDFHASEAAFSRPSTAENRNRKNSLNLYSWNGKAGSHYSTEYRDQFVILPEELSSTEDEKRRPATAPSRVPERAPTPEDLSYEQRCLELRRKQHELQKEHNTIPVAGVASAPHVAAPPFYSWKMLEKEPSAGDNRLSKSLPAKPSAAMGELSQPKERKPKSQQPQRSEYELQYGGGGSDGQLLFSQRRTVQNQTHVPTLQNTNIAQWSQHPSMTMAEDSLNWKQQGDVRPLFQDDEDEVPQPAAAPVPHQRSSSGMRQSLTMTNDSLDTEQRARYAWPTTSGASRALPVQNVQKSKVVLGTNVNHLERNKENLHANTAAHRATQRELTNVSPKRGGTLFRPTSSRLSVDVNEEPAASKRREANRVGFANSPRAERLQQEAQRRQDGFGDDASTDSSIVVAPTKTTMTTLTDNSSVNMSITSGDRSKAGADSSTGAYVNTEDSVLGSATFLSSTTTSSPSPKPSAGIAAKGTPASRGSLLGSSGGWRSSADRALPPYRARSAPPRNHLAVTYGDTPRKNRIYHDETHSNPVLVHKRYPYVSSRQLNRWATETSDSFKWKKQ